MEADTVDHAEYHRGGKKVQQTVSFDRGGVHPVSRSRSMTILAICFLVVLFDGFDTISITFVAPKLAELWGVSPAAMTPAFLGTSLGAVIGYMICGPLERHFGRRPVAVLSVVWFSAGTLATTLVTGITGLAAIRFLTAVGLGAALPIAISSATGTVTARHRGTAAILTAAGLSVGGVVAGISGAPLMAQFGWPAVFIVGGILPLILLPAIYLFIRDVGIREDATRGGNPVAALFATGMAWRTILLWGFAFLVFVDAYALIFWIPSLLVSSGLPKTIAPASAAAFSLGGMVGAVSLVFLIARLGGVRTLMIPCLVGIGAVAFFSLAEPSPRALMPVVFAMGAGFIACCVGQSALAVALYPPQVRTTGVGWAAAAGRIGSVFGPAIGGAVVYLAWTPQQIVLTAVVPAGLALLLLGVLSRQATQPRPAA